ncbi:lytic transglycosylase domain-containing protein [Aestuariibius sp. 2305UL40-4]|uniref:lytic transglycosylase domain-containing protein n=1 Tax=Aestuariibius violaceus TaxID=3234132 RepID=UPI00345E6199
MRRLATVCAAGLLSASFGHAQDAETTEEEVVEPTAAELIDLAYREIASGDWTAARAVASGAGPEGATLVSWQFLRDGGGTFANYEDFLEAYPNWPQEERLRRTAEGKMPRDMAPQRVLAFFNGYEPQTGLGVLRLSDALRATGEGDAADAMIVEAWRTMRLTDAVHDRMLRENAGLLSEHHEARVDMLLWENRIADAQKLLPRMDDGWQKLAYARIALQRQAGDVDARLETVPARLKDDPGLAFDRFEWRLEKQRRDQAIELLAEQSDSAEEVGRPYYWANHRRIIARQLMRAGEDEMAYRIASGHFIDGPERSLIGFTDLEFLSGYIALRKLDDPVQAFRHFAAMAEAARTPISLGRAGYWKGRALEEMGAVNAANAAYAQGGRYQTSFYGLLAAEKAGLPPDPTLSGTERFGDWRAADWAETDVAKVAMWLEEAGRRSMAEIFFLELASNMETREELGQLSHLLTERGASHIAVRVGKAAAARNIVIPEMYFPLHPLAEMEMDVPPELALAIARRESEFDPVVSSPVGAQGLMQLMPATAREVSGWLGLPYTKASLTVDAEYNSKLGIRYLEWLQDRMGPSPTLIAAGYNAGPGRPLMWTDDWGDPRTDGDAVDYIEHIPFRETRNYAMRVTESMPVYKARLTGRVNPPDFHQLIKGIKPLIRPQTRPSDEPEVLMAGEPSEDSPAAVRVRRGSVSTQGFTGPAPVRPEARPAAP